MEAKRYSVNFLIVQYAMNRIDEVTGYKMMKPEYKLEKLKHIENIVKAFHKGMITSNEAMMELSKA